MYRSTSELAGQYPDTNFLIPIKRTLRTPGPSFKTANLAQSILQENQRAKNIVPFFDKSGGTGKTPDAVPDISDDPRNPQRGRAIGFTGGINASNAHFWLSRYYEKVQALGPGIACICDASATKKTGKNPSMPILWTS